MKKKEVKEDIKEEVIDEVKVEKKKRRKKKRIFALVLIFILLIVLGYVFYIKFINKDKEITKGDIEIYKATIDLYGESVTLAINNYMSSNNGKIPTWEDIENDIHTLKNKVSCDHTINYDGSVYLEKCTVEGISYTSNYTYGKKLDEPVRNGGTIYIYKSGENWYNISEYAYDNENYIYVDSYKCYSEDCHGYGVSYVTKEAIIYDNNKYYLYNYGTKKSEELDLGKEELNNIEMIHSSKDTYGLYIINKNYKGAFYNLKNKEYITGFIYNGASNYQVDELLDMNYFAGTITNENTYKSVIDIIDNNKGNKIKTINDAYYVRSESIGNKVIYATCPGGNCYTYKLYNNDFELLTGKESSYYYAVNGDKTITVYTDDNKNEFEIYSNEGKLLNVSNKYKEVVKLVKDYVIVLDNDNNLKLLDKNEKEITTFLKVTSEYALHPMISGWYTENNKNGIYMVVENKNIPYGQEGSGLEYYYIPSTGETGIIKTNGVGGYAKPVLYLYPTKKTQVNISFEKPYLLTTTYPKYNNNWVITAYSNGDLYDNNNKYYYGLYWEEEGNSKVSFNEGFYVTKENAIKFLEEKTEEIGFTRRESNEFIMYWLPILEKNEKNLIYFELTEERNNFNRLYINPNPDSILRVAIHVKKVNNMVKVKEQKLTKFNRKGFTVVEWGGVEH